MSWRQALNSTSAIRSTTPPAPRTPHPALRFDLIDLRCPELLEERAGLVEIELGVRRFDSEEKSVLAGALGETLDVEYRVIRHRQAVEGDHPQHRRERRQQNRDLER